MPFSSPFAPVVVPSEGLVSHLLGDLSADDADHCAVIDHDSGEVLTYGGLVKAVDAFAADVAKQLDPGSVVGVMGPNSARWIVAYLGSLKAGLTVTPLTTLATSAEVAKQLVASRAVQIFSDRDTLDVARSGAQSAGLTESAVINLDGIELATAGDLSMADRVSEPANHLATLPYSSGTTGVPKGVMLSHRNMVANVCQLGALLGIGRDSVVVGILPFAHIYGMTVVVNLSLRRRATIVTMRSFDLAEFLRAIELHAVTHLPVAPPVMVALGKSPLVDDHDTVSVQLVLSGAAPLDASLARTVQDRLGCAVRQAYGMTEMSPVSHVAPLHDASLPAQSVGLIVPGMTCKLVAPSTGAEITQPESGTSEPGELWCQGPNVMVGYLDNPQATADTVDSDGYLHTGDMAVVDAAGADTIVDRLKELIKYKGYQVAPAELEGLLLEHPDIADAAVVGDPLGDGDEAPHAYIVPAPDSNLTADDVISLVNDRVAPYKKIRAVTFLDTIPKSASGKILRRRLRADDAGTTTLV